MKPIPYLTSPSLVDSIVQVIQTDLHELTWLQYIYPIAEVGMGDDGATYPYCYREDGTGEYEPLFPDNTVKSFSFFIDNGFDIGFESEMNTYRLALYVWAKLDNITTSANDFTMALINDVLGKLNENECFAITVSTRDVFAEFSMLDPKDKSNVMRKSTAFRVDFSIYGDNNGCQIADDEYGNYGSRSSATDPGKRGELWYDDDYMYLCVTSGVAGSAVWKKFPIMKSL